MPEVTPAAVMMSPSSTTRSPSRTSTPKLAEVLERGVVGDRGAAAEDARLGEQHRAGADAADPAAARVALGERAP